MIYRSHVLVCGGTGCTASKSTEIMARFEKLLRKIILRMKLRLLKPDVSVFVKKVRFWLFILKAPPIPG